jgi:hypothetical protein
MEKLPRDQRTGSGNREITEGDRMDKWLRGQKASNGIEKWLRGQR